MITQPITRPITAPVDNSITAASTPPSAAPQTGKLLMETSDGLLLESASFILLG